MGLCSSASAALKQPPAPKPAEETGRGEPSEEDKTKVHPASEPIERPDPPAIEEPEEGGVDEELFDDDDDLDDLDFDDEDEGDT